MLAKLRTLDRQSNLFFVNLWYILVWIRFYFWNRPILITLRWYSRWFSIYIGRLKYLIDLNWIETKYKVLITYKFILDLMKGFYIIDLQVEVNVASSCFQFKILSKRFVNTVEFQLYRNRSVYITGIFYIICPVRAHAFKENCSPTSFSG